jgi:pimeloyl-ACP methyl ester carboxylesterase
VFFGNCELIAARKRMTDRVLLLHGLWMRGFTLTPLARRLGAAGFEVQTFDYASVARGPELAVERLAARIGALGGERVHLVGHSLGGLVALSALRAMPDLAVDRIVCLGSPLSGSVAARGLARWPAGRLLMGQSLDVLSKGLDSWDGRREVGVIAGRSPIGLGALVGTLRAPHDGTVAVDETRLDGIAQHRVVQATHSGLVFSDRVAAHAIAFLRTGVFPADEP